MTTPALTISLLKRRQAAGRANHSKLTFVLLHQIFARLVFSA